jgi:hypothetical protein
MFKLDNEFLQIITDLRAAVLKAVQSLRSLFGYAFMVLWWAYVRYIRLVIFPRLPRLFIFVSFIDFFILLAEGLEEVHKNFDAEHPSLIPPAGFHAVIHVIDDKLLGPGPLIAFSIASILLASLMVWHHHRVTERVQQHLFLLGSMREILVEATRLIVSAADPQASDAFIKAALRALTESTTMLKGGHIQRFDQLGSDAVKTKIHGLRRIATVLEIQENNEWFELKPDRQWPPDTYKIPMGKLTKASAAGKALEKPTRATDPRPDKGLIYIPWTYFPHGTRHWVDKKKPQIDYVPDAFANLGVDGDPEPQSTICMEILVPDHAKSRYVLCLDSNRWKCFQEVDFQAISLTRRSRNQKGKSVTMPEWASNY